MKRIFLSTVLLLSLCTLAAAQRKMQFGVTVQAGNYQAAQQEHQGNDFQNSDYRLTSGLLTGLGIYAERTLCKHVVLYSGLNFSRSYFEEQLTNTYPGLSDVYTQKNRFAISQVALPIQLQLRTGGNRQLAFSIGAAPAVARTKVSSSTPGSYDNRNIIVCGIVSYDTYMPENLATKFQVLYTTGLYYRPDVNNTIGLEIWLAPKVKENGIQEQYRYQYQYNLYARPYHMRSLQIALRHSW